MEGIIGRKVGMTQVFLPNGRVEPVTVLEVGPCVVTQVRTPERDGYTAVQLGFGISKRLNKPERGHLKENGNFGVLREFRLDGPNNKPGTQEYAVGQQVSAALFEAGELVDIVGTSKGKGFQGGVKRHNFRGGPKTHGQSDRHRAPGSIGAGTTPGRVLKGTRMAGHMGAERVTSRNLVVVRADVERNLLFVRGAVPGPRTGLVLVHRAKYQRK